MTKSDFAKLNNVSPAAITKACTGALKFAFDGKRIDANHPAAKNYIKKKIEQSNKKEQSTTVSEKLKKVKKEDPQETKLPHDKDLEEYAFVKVEPQRRTRIKNSKNDTEVDTNTLYTDEGREVPENVRKYLKYTVEEVVDKFGTETALNDFLLSVKRIKDIYKTDIANEKAAGELVHKSLIKVGIIDPINTAHTRLLTDGSKTIAKRVKAKLDAGANIYEIEKFISEQITSYIKPMKQSIKRTLEKINEN